METVRLARLRYPIDANDSEVRDDKLAGIGELSDDEYRTNTFALNGLVIEREIGDTEATTNSSRIRMTKQKIPKNTKTHPPPVTLSPHLTQAATTMAPTSKTQVIPRSKDHGRTETMVPENREVRRETMPLRTGRLRNRVRVRRMKRSVRGIVSLMRISWRRKLVRVSGVRMMIEQVGSMGQGVVLGLVALSGLQALHEWERVNRTRI